MKKRYIILAGILAAAALASGCGTKKEDTSKQEPQVTVAPAADTDKDTDNNLVDMQKSTDEDIKNVMGTKTASSSKVILINQTGADVARIYILYLIHI